MTHTAPLYDEDKTETTSAWPGSSTARRLVNESIRSWNGYGQARQRKTWPSRQVYHGHGRRLEANCPSTPEVEAILDRWQANLRHFYEPTLDILRGLGEAYGADPAFRATFVQFHPQLPEYLYEAIAGYVDRLETAALEAMLADDEADAASE
jgi:hypothetical protein